MGNKKLTHFSLFSGIGGIELAAEWAGFETVGQCEWADYPTKVLEKHWPDVERWKDVRDVTSKSVSKRIGANTVCLLSGGFPCQPHSISGLRNAASDERDLWPEYRRVISEIKPKWVLGENVRGLLSSDDGRFFPGIIRDISELGYGVGWCVIPACWVGAVHRRERVFIIAHTGGFGHQGIERFTKDRCKIREGGAGTLGPVTEFFNGINWKARAIKSGFLGANDGVPNRVDRLKCLGNAVVPQQVYPILAAIAKIEEALSDT